MTADEFNKGLAGACKACESACCKKGKIFLSPEEEARLARHAASLGPAAQEAYEGRLEAREGFSLYDQRDRCQFLTADNLCSLHALGIKPNECFWWPYHVYVDSNGAPVIELSTTCCDAWKLHDLGAAAGFLEAIDDQVNALGVDVIRAFRKAYDGSYGRTPVRPVNLLR